MKLIKFKVENFRSIVDSGWIYTDDVTSLVGVNEAGKSNILLALWKLNPTAGGEINFLEDMPRTYYSEWRKKDNKPIFVTAQFEIEDITLIDYIISVSDCSFDEAKIVQVSIDYDGTYFISFPQYYNSKELETAEVEQKIISIQEQLQNQNEEGKSEKGLKDKILNSLKKCLTITNGKEKLSDSDIDAICGALNIKYKPLQKSKIQPILKKLQDDLNNLYSQLNRSEPSDFLEIRKRISQSLPKFVYYSNYGNLDSEIFLPHVIDNMERQDLSPAMKAKTRTLKVLFDFVDLDPVEILKLGEEEKKVDAYNRIVPLTEEEVEVLANRKSERDVLLQSAGLQLTQKFAEWWKQGNYKFRFQADGKNFKIWVSDEKRPEEISLEGRSTGLQWFLSFYLIFLVESKNAHKNAILLLDEAGVSLHPVAQKDLVSFFENLSLSNQLIHTTHSPFLVNTGNIDRVKVVYMDDNGSTVTSNDLRAADNKLSKTNSVYAVHAALGLSISDVLLQGCNAVIVEGPSDQFYLNAMKNYLINKGKLKFNEEIVFIPSGGVRGIKPLASFLTGKDEQLPTIIIDSDKSGKGFKESIKKELYKDFGDKIIEIEDLVDIPFGEVEDLIPIELLERRLNNIIGRTEDDFIDSYDSSKAIIPQIEQFCINNQVDLPKGWKVDLARNVKKDILNPKSSRCISQDIEDVWKALFNKITAFEL